MRAILEQTPQLGPVEWWLTGGAVSQNVWNAVQGRAPAYGVKDYVKVAEYGERWPSSTSDPW